MRIGRWVAASAITVAVVAGLGVRLAHKSSAEGSQAKQALSQLSSLGQTPAAALKLAGDVANQGIVSNLMTKYRLDSRSAAFIAQAKIQMLGSSNTSIHYLLTFPDGVTSEETITISPARNYKPTATELQNSKPSGIQIFKPTLSMKKTAPKEISFTLHYYALRSSLPPDFQQWLQTSFPTLRSSRESFFNLVPSAWAQANGGDNGAESLTFNLIELDKNLVVHGLENAEMEKSAHALDNLLTVKDLIKGYMEASDWLGEISALQNCARNPTNPLAIKASQDPDYQKVLDSLDDASSEIQMTAFPKVANIAASAMTQFIPVFGLGVYISPIVDANDEAIAQVAEGTIADARKAVTSCDEMKEPPQKNRGDGSITFHTQLKYFNGLDKYDRYVKGDFDLVADPTAGVGAPGRGFFRVKGVGVFTQRSESSTYHTKNKCAAQAQIDGHGSDMMGNKILEIGSIMIGGSGDCVMESSGHVTHSAYYQDPGASCKFTDVDLVNGGNYTTHPEGEPVWSAGTECILELRPRQK